MLLICCELHLPGDPVDSRRNQEAKEITNPSSQSYVNTELLPLRLPESLTNSFHKSILEANCVQGNRLG